MTEPDKTNLKLPQAAAQPSGQQPQWWQRYGNLSQIGSPFVAVVAALLAGWFVSTQIDANRQSAARQMFRSHLELEMKYATLAEPNFDAIKLAGKVELNQYSAFVNHLLYTCEELTIATRDDAGWRTACESRLKAHSQYLCGEVSKDDLETYDLRIQKMIVSTRCKSGCRVDDCSKWVKT